MHNIQCIYKNIYLSIYLITDKYLKKINDLQFEKKTLEERVGNSENQFKDLHVRLDELKNFMNDRESMQVIPETIQLSPLLYH